MDDYKTYSLGQLENWLHDAISAGEATAEEVYDTIKKVVEEEYHTYKNHTSKCYELLALLNGNGKGHIEEYDAVMREKEYYEPSMPPWGHSDMEYLVNQSKITKCDKDDPSPECKKSWNDFWEEAYYPEEVPVPLLINKEGDMWARDTVVKKDKVNKWILPVEVDGLTGDCLISLPDDLLEAANLKEGDTVEWIDNKDGSFAFKKCEPEKPKGLPTHQELMNNGYKTYEEAVKDGWKMTADGFWIKEN